MPDTTMPAVECALETADADLQRALDAQLDKLMAKVHPDRVKRLEKDAKLRLQCEAIAEACATDPRTDDPYYTTEDVLGWVARATDKGCAMPRLGPDTVRRVFRVEVVPNAGLREEYERQRDDEGGEGLASRLAEAVFGEPDTEGLNRLLGIEPTYREAEGKAPSLRLFVSYEQAVKVADALDLTYHDYGL